MSWTRVHFPNALWPIGRRLAGRSVGAVKQNTCFYFQSSSPSFKQNLMRPFAVKTRYGTTAIRLCEKNDRFCFLVELECSYAPTCFGAKQLLHLDCPHMHVFINMGRPRWCPPVCYNPWPGICLWKTWFWSFYHLCFLSQTDPIELREKHRNVT